MNTRDKSLSIRNKRTAFLLALFLGYAGIHHFYLGKVGRGIFHVTFFVAVSFFTIQFYLWLDSLGKLLAFFFIIMFGLMFAGFWVWVLVIWVIGFLNVLGMSEEKFNLSYNPHLYIRKDLIKPAEIAEEIEKLDKMFEQGHITYEDFERRKAKLLEG